MDILFPEEKRGEPAHGEVHHPGCFPSPTTRRLSSDLTGLDHKENPSSDENSRTDEFSGSIMSPKTQVLSSTQLCHFQGVGDSSYGLETAASVPGITSGLRKGQWERSRVWFCFLLFFFPMCLLPLFLKQRKLSWHPLVTFSISLARTETSHRQRE